MKPTVTFDSRFFFSPVDFTPPNLKFLILSTESPPQLVEHVMVRLRKQGHTVVRLNLTNFTRPEGLQLGSMQLADDDFCFLLQGQSYRLSDFDVVWSRRFRDNFTFNLIPLHHQDGLPREVAPFLQKEMAFIAEHILFLARHQGIRIINDYEHITINKLSQITLARKYGLKAPRFQVVNTKSALRKATEDFGGAITKPMSNLGYVFDQKKAYSAYTKSLDEKSMRDFSDRFFPSLVQEKVPVASELKCLLVGDKLLAVQQLPKNGALESDIKKAFKDHQVSLLPYQLPPNIQEALFQFAKSLRLDLCSIDVLVTPDDEHYFLEINQDGIVGYYAEFQSESVIDLLEMYLIHGTN